MNLINLTESLENLRISYQHSSLDTTDCPDNPFAQFEKWLQEAMNAKCDEPNTFVLSTVSENRPRSRVVLLKGLSPQGPIFYTNYESHKGQEIDQNKNVAMNFLWLPLQRQIRIEGTISLIDEKTSDDYFKKRPRGSQLGAIASPQSAKIESRKILEKTFQEVEEKFSQTSSLIRPRNWGGYVVEPRYFEFWQGRENRLHDRICYERSEKGWEIFRLAP